MEKCEMKGLIKTDMAVVVLYFVKIYTGKEFQKYLLQNTKLKLNIRCDIIIHIIMIKLVII